VTRHHRKPKAQKGRAKDGISEVSDAKHRAWHTLFSGERSTRSIVKELNDVWIDPEYILTVRKRGEDE